MAKSRTRGQERSRPQSPGLRLAAEAVGGYDKLADKLRITSQAVSGWYKIPVNRCGTIERLTGIPREKLRPDIFRR